MSIMSSVFFILLCFASMHAKSSEARYVGLGRSHKGFRALFPHPDKGQFLAVEKLRLEMDSSTKESVLVKQDEDLAAEQKGTHEGAVFSTTTTTTTKGMKDDARTSTPTKSDVVPDVKPHVSASWPVPHQIKNRDKIINHGDKSSGVMEYAGSEIFESSSSSSAHMGLHKDKATTATNKESRRGLYAKDRQTDYKVEDGNDDGVVLEDYKAPHQTPPIHNRGT